jgi:hypothetical protein
MAMSGGVAAAKAIATTAAGASLVAAAPVSAATVATAMFLAMFPAAVSLCIGVAFEVRRKMAERWWEKVVEGSRGKTSSEVQGIIDAHIDEPHIYDTVTESVRRLLEAVDPEVAPVLGALAAEYIHGKKKPDAFYRGFARLLADLSPPEHESLAALVARCAPLVDADGIVKLAWNTKDEKALVIFETHLGPKRDQPADISPIPSLRRLVHLLRANGFEELGNSGLSFGSSDDGWGPVFQMPGVAIEHMKRVLF